MADHVGRPQGGMKSEAGRAAYWRMQHESAIGALADLIAEHRELVTRIEALAESLDGARISDVRPHHSVEDYFAARLRALTEKEQDQ